jgi:hypothetical protein
MSLEDSKQNPPKNNPESDFASADKDFGHFQQVPLEGAENTANTHSKANSNEAGYDAFDQAIIEWDAHVHPQYERGWPWLLTIGVILTICFAYAVWYRNWTFLIALLVGSYFYVDHFRRDSAKVRIKISDFGIKDGQECFAFADIKAFAISYFPDQKELHLMTNRKLFPTVTIQLENQDPALIRSILLNQIPEISNYQEPIIDTLVRKLKF